MGNWWFYCKGQGNLTEWEGTAWLTTSFRRKKYIFSISQAVDLNSLKTEANRIEPPMQGFLAQGKARALIGLNFQSEPNFYSDLNKHINLDPF
jgi:hypothetical protein